MLIGFQHGPNSKHHTYYLQVLATLREYEFVRNGQKLWKTSHGILYQDHSPTPIMRCLWNVIQQLEALQFSNMRRTQLIQHPVTFSEFALKRTRLESIEEVKQNSAELLKALTKNDFQHCFGQSKKSSGTVCVGRGGEQIEGSI